MHKNDKFVQNGNSHENINVRNLHNLRKSTDPNINPEYPPNSFSQMVQQKQSTCNTQLESFESSMKYFVLLGQYICLFPIFPMKQIKKYPLLSWRYIFTFLTCVTQLAAAFLCFNEIIRTSVNIGKLGSVIFYSKSCFCTILTIRLSLKWHYLTKQVVAANLNEYIDESIKFKCKLVIITFLSLSLINYCLSNISKFATILDCAHNNSTVYEQYITNSYKWFFGIGVSFYLPHGIFLLYLFLCCIYFNNLPDATFQMFAVVVVRAKQDILTMIGSLSLTYCQVLVICVSLYLSSILQQLNKKIIALDCKYVTSSYWRALRQDYNRATRLIYSFDDVINSIVLVSFASNLFYVCLQIFYVLRNDITIRHGTPLCNNSFNKGQLHGYDHVITNIYFVYSTILVIGRTLIVSLIAARVHSTSLEIIPILYSVPPPTYSVEIQRFIDQIHGNTVALTGFNFFYVTKELFLSMIGTIVTYELVLLQIK